MPETKLSFKKNRIRDFFLLLDNKTKTKERLNETEDDLVNKGMVYVQMRLPVEKISPEFEASLKKKIQENFIKAKIRVATNDDLESLRALYNRAWLSTNEPYRPIEIETLEKILNASDTIFLIAKVYGIDAGFAILDFEGNDKEIGNIAGMGVIPRFQRKGLGTILGMAAWNYFKEKGVKELSCEVYKDNNVSYTFIKWLGFQESGKKVYRKEDFLIEEND